MNRKQRRQMQKQLGLIRFNQEMSSEQKLKRIAKSSKEGKEKEKEMKETIRRQKQEMKDRESSGEVASLATTLMLTERLSYIEALEEAKKRIQQKNSVEEEI